jgi:hypothetical protein
VCHRAGQDASRIGLHAAHLFPDVAVGSTFCTHIKRLRELNVTTGYADGTYGPDNLVTREQMAAFLSRAFLGMQ